uniref:Uncharacterized protein n=1 Tax=Picea glauca TaxID=3330 RepID=A0A101LYP7_PICGL|nr:hypothetical protein ABT39_MTgene4779 [Picea glauca]
MEIKSVRKRKLALNKFERYRHPLNEMKFNVLTMSRISWIRAILLRSKSSFSCW